MLHLNCYSRWLPNIISINAAIIIIIIGNITIIIIIINIIVFLLW